VGKRTRHIILLRFSAIGDVAIGAPLIRYYAGANPDIKFTIVSQPRLEPLFSGIDNLYFFPVDFKKKHKGFKGLTRLFLELSRLGPTDIADLHNVTRTWVLRSYFFFTFKRIAFLHKGRLEKAKLTRKRNKVLKQLPSTISRYEKVLVKLGLEDLNFSGKANKPFSVKRVNYFKIGIAPFAKHKGKSWPFEYIEEVVAALSKEGHYSIFLFGGGKIEENMLHLLEQRYSGVHSVAGKYSLREELEIINDLDMMLSMDSANMHLASFVGVPVISIWGATHPYTGFYGWNQSPDNAVQIEMECSPCSVFGNKKCFRGDYACLLNIMPQLVLNKIEELTSGEV
jgi:ADP-heptose:LPS heptosyltransferase